MEDASKDETAMTTADALKTAGKLALVPVVAGAPSSRRREPRGDAAVLRAGHVRGRRGARIGANAFVRACGPAFGANAARNAIMATTSFVARPTLYRKYYPQDQKSKGSLFCFGLGLNIFFGRAGDHAAVALGPGAGLGRATGRPVSYAAVVSQGYKAEGLGAFITAPKWFSRVMMNAPIQGTMPWFYNNVLPPSARASRSRRAAGAAPPRARARPSVTLRGHGSGRERV
ncbi:hypothetical protein SO694_00013480 [Aureococcus anophagefferens]|uniref:Uncharacterized protein n=1 Tax=Aureococcus anophagefferens TaxID=44056 RepID=A0ABR1G166_AURAN